MSFIENSPRFSPAEEQLLCNRYAAVQERVAQATRKAGRNPKEVTLIAVGKKHPAQATEIISRLGHKTFGENYVQEVLHKQEELSHLAIEWHYIGALQSKKAKDVVGRFSLIHTVDRLKLAQNLQKRMEMLPASGINATAPVQDILLQVNISNEEQKAGVSRKELVALGEAVMEMPQIHLCGLMCMPPAAETGELSRPYFSELKTLRDSLEKALGITLPHLSMGMSQDFEQAIEEGATLVRIGTDIFGPRQY